MAATDAATLDSPDVPRDDWNASTMNDAERVASTERLISEHHASVYRYAYWLTNCQASAEDITQDVFVRAFRGLHHLREERAAKSWLMTITRNEFSRWCKKLGPKPISNVVESEQTAGDPSEVSENVDWVSKALAELPSEFRLVVMMFYFEQMSYAEIAEELEMPIGTVMSRLSRGRTHLKNALDRLAQPNQL